MAKKVVGEDGKTYKVKKPFYKRVWFWILAVIVVAAIGGAIGGGNSDTSASSDKASSSKTSKAKSSSSKKDDGKISREQFDNIKLGDLMQNADGGVTLDELTKSFGKPDSTSTSTTNGVTVDMVTWTNVEGGLGANIIVGFNNKSAYSKNITGFKFDRDKKITLADFEAVANGNAYSDIIKKFGEPDGLNESLIGGTKTVIASYMSGVKGSLGANFNITFTNDVVSGKSQSNME